MIPKYLKKKKVGGAVGSTDSLQILFVQKKMEVQRSAERENLQLLRKMVIF